MFCDGTTICQTCRKRVPAASGICRICGHVLESREVPQAIQPKVQEIRVPAYSVALHLTSLFSRVKVA